MGSNVKHRTQSRAGKYVRRQFCQSLRVWWGTICPSLLIRDSAFYPAVHLGARPRLNVGYLVQMRPVYSPLYHKRRNMWDPIDAIGSSRIVSQDAVREIPTTSSEIWFPTPPEVIRSHYFGCLHVTDN